MNTLVCLEPGVLKYQQSGVPASVNGHSIIRIKKVGICGTDIHAFEGTQPYFTYPRILGHEIAGELVDANGASGFTNGELVTIVPYLNCGHCIACRHGRPNCCTTLQVTGVHRDGGMVEYLSVRSDLLVHGNGLSDNQLALVEPFAIGAHGIRRAQIIPGEFVLVIGAGPIGLGAMEMARLAGGVVIAMDVNDERLTFCLETLKIDHAINAASDVLMETLLHITEGDLPTLVIDATGNQNAINGGFRYLAHGGRYVLIGLQKGEIRFSHPDFHKRELTLMSSRNSTSADFQHVIECIKQGLVNPLSYITHQLSFSEVSAEFHRLTDPANRVIKAVVSL